MILFKKWVNQFLREKRRKKWKQKRKQEQSFLFKFCNTFDV